MSCPRSSSAFSPISLFGAARAPTPYFGIVFGREAGGEPYWGKHGYGIQRGRRERKEIQRQSLPLCAREGEKKGKKRKERVCGGGLWRWSRAEREWEIRLNRSSLTNITNSWGRVGWWGLVNRKMEGRVGVRRGIKDVMGERGKGEGGVSEKFSPRPSVGKSLRKEEKTLWVRKGPQSSPLQ